MMPASMALIRQAFPDPKARGRAVGVWTMGGSVASSSGPVLGGALNLVDWRLIFFLNVPVGAIALLLLARTQHSQPRVVPFDMTGQITGVLAMGGLTFGAIQAGSHGFADPAVIAAFAAAQLPERPLVRRTGIGELAGELCRDALRVRPALVGVVKVDVGEHLPGMRDPVPVGESRHVKVVPHLVAPDDSIALAPQGLVRGRYAQLLPGSQLDFGHLKRPAPDELPHA